MPEANALHALETIVVLIPVWQPGADFPLLLERLAQESFGEIIVVDDGSGPASQPIFTQIACFPRTKILQHTRNRGKGRALKTGFRHLLTACPEAQGLVTADADGQHTPEDIVRVAEALLQSNGRAVLGSRRFGPGVPWRSRWGNRLMGKLFGWLTGTDLADTQTGLRGLPKHVLPDLLTVEGERYEYESAMLLYLCRTSRPPLEVPIATVYLEGNPSSHFRPVRDTLRILRVFLEDLLQCVGGRARQSRFWPLGSSSSPRKLLESTE